MLRRTWCKATLAALASTMGVDHMAAAPFRLGRLLIIGGAEDKIEEQEILRRFVELSGGAAAPLGVITAASVSPQSAWDDYKTVFSRLGVSDVVHIDVETDDLDEAANNLLACRGVFMTGGDQARLMQAIGSTPVAVALHRSYHDQGVCIAGTSAGAAVMSRYMLARGTALVVPEKDGVSMDLGLGLVPLAVIDQHFSERRRLSRLLSALARRPDMMGLGIDENTAVLIEPAKALEVIGAGSATIVDCSEMVSNVDEVEDAAKLEMLGMKLHILPTGQRYQVSFGIRTGTVDPGGIHQAIRRLVSPGPIRIA